MISKVFAFMEQYHMVEEQDLVVIGVSGGADSLCLLFLLLEYRKQVDFYPVVVHINHGLRKEAVTEAVYVKEVCEREKLPFFLKEADVKEVSKIRRISTEEAGRQIRYEAFEEALEIYAKKGKGQKIAVAHHGEDQAETMLFHLFRGTGIYGMAGIMPVREKIIRPLLLLQKDEIECFLRKRGISWCVDESNKQDIYTRNKIRNHILAYAKEEINEKAISHLSAAAMQMVALREYLEKEVGKAENLCSKREGERIYVDLSLFMEYPLLIRNQILLSLLSHLVWGRKDITSLHLEEIEMLLTKKGSKELHLPGNTVVKKQYEKLILERKKEKQFSFLRIEELKEGCYPLGEEEELELSLRKKEDSFEIEENQYTKYLDYDKISNCLSLRTRQKGDFLVMNELGQKKRLKDYMIDQKIPKELRDSIPLLADGSHILWIIGYRISSYYKVKEETKRILQVKKKRREKHGRED